MVWLVYLLYVCQRGATNPSLIVTPVTEVCIQLCSGCFLLLLLGLFFVFLPLKEYLKIIQSQITVSCRLALTEQVDLFWGGGVSFVGFFFPLCPIF